MKVINCMFSYNIIHKVNKNNTIGQITGQTVFQINHFVHLLNNWSFINWPISPWSTSVVSLELQRERERGESNIYFNPYNNDNITTYLNDVPLLPYNLLHSTLFLLHTNIVVRVSRVSNFRFFLTNLARL